MDKKNEPEIIEVQLSKITKDKKQTTIRIPSMMVLEFLINPKRDAFLWVVEKIGDGISLRGNLIKGINVIDKKIKNEKKT